MDIYNKKRQQTLLILILSIFAAIFCLISFVNHYQFRTYALDLGMFNQAVFAISRCKEPIFSLGLEGVETHFLATHFSLITYLFAPFVYVFGSYTLLIIQIASIILGGLASYKYAKVKFKEPSYVPTIILIQFFCMWGIYSALSFDFHNNVIGAMLLLWFVYFLELRRLILASLFLLLAVVSQENIALWSIFVLLGLVIKDWKTKRTYFFKFEYPALLAVVVYTLTVLVVIMPLLQHSANNLQFGRYAHLGNSFSEIIFKIIENPKYIFSLFFEDVTSQGITFGIKSELHFMVLVSGGFALFYRPAYLIMLTPIYAQKLLTNDFVLWGINLQYSIEFVPIITLCLIDFLESIKSKKLTYCIAVGTALSTLFFTYRTIETRRSIWYDKINTAFYDLIHYKTDLDIGEINTALTLIPTAATVSTSPAIASHLAYCNKLYHFPIIKDAGYIVLLKANSTYPLSAEEFSKKEKELKSNASFQILYDKNDLLILKLK